MGISIQIKNLTQYTGLVLIVLLLCTACIVSADLVEGIESAKRIWFILITGLILIWSAFYLKKAGAFALNQLDWLVAFYFIFILLNNILRQQFNWPTNVETFCLLLTYLFVRQLLSDSRFPIRLYIAAVLLFSIGQVLIAVLQWFELMPAYNINFKFTGFFFNPAPFIIFFTSLFIYGLVAFLFNIKALLKYLGLFVVICGLPVIVISASRSAYLGLGAAILVLVFFKYRSKLNLHKRGANFIKVLTFAGVLASFVFIIRWLYLFKKDSADGRMLIWKLSGKMFSDNVWTGVGADSFPAQILNYQSQYFQQYPDKMPTEGRLTDIVFYAFNDILQLACEQGVMALVLFILILIVAFKLFRSQIQNKQLAADQSALIISAAASIIVIVISGMFSYPMETLPVRIVFFVSLAIISAGHEGGQTRHREQGTSVAISARYSMPIRVLGIATGCGLCFFAGAMYMGYKQGKIVKEKGYANSNMQQLNKYDAILKNTAWYELQKCDYLLYKGDYKKAIVCLEQIKSLCPGRVIYSTLGSLYTYNKNYKKAGQQYTFLYYALPALVEPKYQLAKFYYDTGQQAKWKIAAREVINFHPKIASNITDQMVTEIKELYKK